MLMVADCTPICALLVRRIDADLASWSGLSDYPDR
jgi:hypothetical protein